MRACWSGPAACGLSWPVQAACAPSGYFNTWPPIVVEFADRVGQGLEPMRLPPPSPAAGIGTIHGFWASTQASAICAPVRCLRAAISPMRSTNAWLADEY